MHAYMCMRVGAHAYTRYIDTHDTYTYMIHIHTWYIYMRTIAGIDFLEEGEELWRCHQSREVQVCVHLCMHTICIRRHAGREVQVCVRLGARQVQVRCR